jgi:HSP90 family molecular chaperone
VAELVENSIDARATSVWITRGRSEGKHYLEIRDDGQGIPRDAEGHPDFRYVATHICDSVKRRLKVEGVSGLQGEFGIGLLSFWTLGEELTLTSTGAEERAWQMVMRKGDPGYTVKARRTLFAEPGTQLRINRLLEGIRSLSGEKIQWYLAAELRDRIRHSSVRITVIDKTVRRQIAARLARCSRDEGRCLR